MADDTQANERLYLVYVQGAERPDKAVGNLQAVRLAETLFLVRSAQTRSELYHAVKRRSAPGQLLVAPLDGDPKFKGMAAGALKWLRASADG